MRFQAEIEKKNFEVIIRPLYSSDQEKLAKLKQGTTYRFTITQDRSTVNHRKFFALLNLSYENQDKINNFDHHRKLLIMKAGFYDAVETDKGVIYLPHSISFENMDEITFQNLFDRVLDVVATELESNALLIKEQLNDFM